nr:uncharacterized protein LOC105343675 isoform X1 [Crassostrea gigas]XP_034315316.1 uncharacterized protein LOC105343675 isoform X1 [Crassostrea gigas]XP_034315317.1 uncharacterized protein LOC105343675 isoform X1 [Crassostrea gigas]
MPGLSFPPHACSSPVNRHSPGISSATGEGMKLAGLSALSLVAADDGTDSSLHGPFHQRKHVTAEWSLSSLFSLRFKEVAQVFEVFNHMPLLFRCTGSSSTISITGEMGNDEWTVITLQLTDAFRSPSLFVFNGGLWRNGCSAAFMSGAAWNGVFPIALKVALLYRASPSTLIGVLASPHFSLSS